MASDSPKMVTCPSATAVTCSPPSKKRNREPDDEAYLDNFQTHRRYLGEVIAYSLNGLTVGDSAMENEDLLESPVQSEIIGDARDEFSLECSRMSEDSEDSQCCDSLLNTSCSTSPSSPSHDYQRVSPARASTSNLHPHPTCSHPRQRRTDSDGIRFPLSPSDVCHGGDLRRTALLRSVQMRAHPVAYELPFGRDLSSEREEC